MLCDYERLLSDEQSKIIVNSWVISCLDYGNGLYFDINERLLNQLQLIQNAAAKAITKKYKHGHIHSDIDSDLIMLHCTQVSVIYRICSIMNIMEIN